jgi:hypothetical protein
MSWSDRVTDEFKFIITPNLLMHLETWVASANGREVSGVGTVEINSEDKTFTLKKVWLMASGSSSYTEIPGERMVELLKQGVKPNEIKVWWHRHPVGNGVTGSHNWSGTDNNTIRNEPFGIDPSMVKWLLSIVRTPLGWVARHDNHETKTTIHFPVDCGINREEYVAVESVVRQPAPVEQAPRQRTSVPLRPRRVRYQDSSAVTETALDVVHSKRVFKDLGMKPARELFADHARKNNTEQLLIDKIADELQFDRAEFVAYDNGMSVHDLMRLGLLSKDEVEEVERRVQRCVDNDVATYIALVRNWEDYDGQD